MHVSEIDTPALVVDLDVMERNLRRVADYTRQHGLRLRPHTKTHKSTRIGSRQLQLGAAGLTVAKISEAEVMMGAEPPDLLVAYPIIGRTKLQRLTALAGKTADHRGARQPGRRAPAFRCRGRRAGRGRGPGGSRCRPRPRGRISGKALLELAQGIEKLPHLRLEGITFYPGQVKDLEESGLRAFAHVAELLRSILADFRAAGVEVKIVSGGSTPTLFHSHELDGLTEIRPGTYVFNDINTVRSGGCSLEDCAASILATVVSTARPGQMIVDGGSKTFSSDRLANPAEATFGHVVEAPAARFHKMNEEHGYVDITRAEREFSIGDRVHIVPNHICVAVNLHEQVYGIRGDQVEEVWKVEGRGKLQ